MTVLYAKEYVKRTLFILKHKEKFILCYRSSGESGTGHKGQILPFSGLNLSSRGIRSEPVGYIFKEMFYNGEWVYHGKELQDFEGLEEQMQDLKEFLDCIRPDISFNMDDNYNEDGIFDVQTWKEYVIETAHEIKEIIGEMEPYDLKEKF